MEQQMNGAELQELIDSLQNSPSYQYGNASQYSLENQSYNANSPLNGQKIGFLGSSITYGAFSHGVSFVDYLQVCDGVAATKSAVSGTTLAGTEKDGYLQRLQADFDPQAHWDLFVCQLSTNDTRQGKPIGKISDTQEFNLETTLGAIQYLNQYVQKKLNCPLVFYTCALAKKNKEYEHLIDMSTRLASKNHFQVIDLYHDTGLNASLAGRKYAMFDEVHPTQEGYLKVWLPVFEKSLVRILKKND